MARRVIGNQFRIGSCTAEAGLLSAGIAFASFIIASARSRRIKREFALRPPLPEQIPALIQLHCTHRRGGRSPSVAMPRDRWSNSSGS
jgi:hypothetical protein